MTDEPAEGLDVSSDTTEPTETGEVLLRVSRISKAFGATQAVRNASLDVRTGEIHAIVGENGSGKSTLIKILSGVHAPDGGSVEVAGAPWPGRPTPRSAQERGIVTVFQEVLVAEARSVLDNVWLGADGLFRARVSHAHKRALASEMIGRIVGRQVDLSAPVERFSLSDRQAFCIVRALLRRPRVLFLDEATSALDIATRDRLFGAVRGLRKRGAGIVFITHRMDEIEDLADRITIMRTGETVATLGREAGTTPELLRLMTGSSQLVQLSRERDLQAPDTRAPVLRARGLQLQPGRQPLDAVVRAGEIVGVAGLEGHGQHEFLEALRGAGRHQGEIVVHDGGRDRVVRSARHAAARGIAYVPRERSAALFGWMSVRENFAMPTLRDDSRLGWLHNDRTRRRLAAYVEQLGIVIGSPEHSITTLSGGNQQKVLIARWLATRPRVLLLNDPTRGVDLATKHNIYRLLIELAGSGLAIVMLSTELDEHVVLMDRVFVFREHEIRRVIPRHELTRQTLIAGFFADDADRTETAAQAEAGP